MSKISLVLLTLVYGGLLSGSAVFAQKPAAGSMAPIPPALRAEKVFVSNAGADSGLFPAPFSGDPDRPYAGFYATLKARGECTLVPDPSDADLVLELRLTAPYGPSEPNKVKGAADPLPMLRLVIYDRKTHYVLWALTESIEYAFLQKTHDRNFDEAIGRLVDDFARVRHAQPANVVPGL